MEEGTNTRFYSNEYAKNFESIHCFNANFSTIN